MLAATGVVTLVGVVILVATGVAEGVAAPLVWAEAVGAARIKLIDSAPTTTRLDIVSFALESDVTMKISLPTSADRAN